MLDPRLLRSFIAIVDAGGFTLAAERLNMTQSTISQQLARLEEAVGAALLDRAARPVKQTVAGERLLGYARRILALQQEAQSALGDSSGTSTIRIGVPEDIVTSDMAKVFRDFAASHREVHLDVTAGLSRDLSTRYRSGEFDIVIVKEIAAGADCRASFPEAMGWYESAAAPQDLPNPVPLVCFPPGGLYREAMFERIEQEQLRWYIAFSGSSLHNVLVAVEAGLGISLLPRNAVSGYKVRQHARFHGEQPIAISVYAWESAGPMAELVAGMAAVLASRSSTRRSASKASTRPGTSV